MENTINQELEELKEAMKLHVMFIGDFDDGAYGRYDESVFCGYVAYFTEGPFMRTPHGRGKTPNEALANLYKGVKDKQRLEGLIKKLRQ